MKFLLVVMYDHACPGARALSATMLEAGHDVSLMHFKRQSSQFIPRGEEHKFPETRQAINFYVPKPEGNYYLPFPTAVTEEEKELFVDWIRDHAIEAVGFSLLTPFSVLAAELSHRLRERMPKVKILWGGIHPWFTAEDSLQHADVVCLGEGEDALLEFAANPNRTDIQNLWFNVNGTIVRNPKRILQKNLDEFPMAMFGHQEFMLEDNQVTQIAVDPENFFFDSYYISTQRGCPYQCTYCSNSMKKVEYAKEAFLRRRSHEHVFRELDLRVPEFGLTSVRLLDDVFLVQPSWVKRFCEEYPSRVGLPFGCYGYPIAGTEEMLEYTQKAGMKYVNMGVQTGSPYVMREVFGRKYDLNLLERICRKAEDLGIELIYDLLVFNPFENEQHMKETLEFVLQLPSPSATHTFRLSLFPGTKLPDMTLPTYDLPEKLRLFYALLYHATRHRELPRDLIRSWADNPQFRDDPEKLAEVLTVLISDHDKVRYLEAVIAQLRNEVAERDSAKWFLRKVYGRARRMAGSAASSLGIKNGRGNGAKDVTVSRQ